ncbi:MAG: heavy-metal-associated domain-containing protein [Bacteroidia bacterium]|nr:heavy-metal-associated domain-containing protein [Bacteroidia bacterium]
MKTFILILFLLLSGVFAYAQTKKIQIQTSAVCDMCKSLIEKNLQATPGIQKATLSLSTKKVSVQFDETVISADSIRTIITRLGYNADDKVADKKAYEELHTCCKNPRTFRKPKP